jgi:hypothetical protein
MSGHRKPRRDLGKNLENLGNECLQITFKEVGGIGCPIAGRVILT